MRKLMCIVSVWEDKKVLEKDWWRWLHNNMNVLNTTELYMHFITRKKEKKKTHREKKKNTYLAFAYMCM